MSPRQLLVDYISEGRWGLFEVLPPVAQGQPTQNNVITTSDSPLSILRQLAVEGIGPFNTGNSQILLPDMARFAIEIEKLDTMNKHMSEIRRQAADAAQRIKDGKEVSIEPPIDGTFRGQSGDGASGGGNAPRRAYYGKARRKNSTEQ